MAGYKLTKMFNSRDGKLEPDSRKYGMTQEGLNEIGDAKPHLGGATHLFIKVKGGPSNRVLFFTRDGQHKIHAEEKEHGWAEYGLEHGSGYVPERGETGWWNVQVEGAESDVVEGLGLPNSEHISTFVVFEWVEEENNNGEDEIGDPPEIPGEDKTLIATILLYDDGSYDFKNHMAED